MDKSFPETIQAAVDVLRDQGWLVTIKAMPEELPFTIPGASSEYDAPHDSKEVWHGKTVVDLTDMENRTSFNHRRNIFAVGDSIQEALKEAWKKAEPEVTDGE